MIGAKQSVQLELNNLLPLIPAHLMPIDQNKWLRSLSMTNASRHPVWAVEYNIYSMRTSVYLNVSDCAASRRLIIFNELLKNHRKAAPSQEEIWNKMRKSIRVVVFFESLSMSIRIHFGVYFRLHLPFYSSFSCLLAASIFWYLTKGTNRLLRHRTQSTKILNRVQ